MVASIDKLVCPVCSGKLTFSEQMLKCDQQHSFDVAREGYVNLLLSQHKQSKDPGDSKEMIKARAAFHQRGYYQPLATRLSQLVDTVDILDIGCGEGSYAAWIMQANPTLEYYGVDISKHGIRHAASQNPGATFVIASNWHLPFGNHSFSRALTIFAPVDQRELSRVLAPQGRWINVTPGKNHLIELRSALYDQVTRIDKQTSLDGWTITNEQSLSSTIHLDQTSLANLINMTPYAWQAKRSRVAELRDRQEMDLTFDFRITTRLPAVV